MEFEYWNDLFNVNIPLNIDNDIYKICHSIINSIPYIHIYSTDTFVILLVKIDSNLYFMNINYIFNNITNIKLFYPKTGLQFYDCVLIPEKNNKNSNFINQIKLYNCFENNFVVEVLFGEYSMNFFLTKKYVDFHLI